MPELPRQRATVLPGPSFKVFLTDGRLLAASQPDFGGEWLVEIYDSSGGPPVALVQDFALGRALRRVGVERASELIAGQLDQLQEALGG